jgi:uncharacterized protein YjbI with pentapeptide repeats
MLSTNETVSPISCPTPNRFNGQGQTYRGDSLYGNYVGANFRGAKFSSTTFTTIDLTNADFREATFNSCVFTGANLTGADFRNATLIGVRFIRLPNLVTNLTGADFRNAIFNGIIIEDTVIMKNTILIDTIILLNSVIYANQTDVIKTSKNLVDNLIPDNLFEKLISVIPVDAVDKLIPSDLSCEQKNQNQQLKIAFIDLVKNSKL